MNITMARKLAMTSTQHGFFNQQGNLWVHCPQCRAKIHTTYNMWCTDGKGKRLNEIGQIRHEVFEHLTHDECVELPKGLGR